MKPSTTPLIDEHIGDVYDEHMVTTAARLLSGSPEQDNGIVLLLLNLIDVPYADRGTLLAELRKIAARPDQFYELDPE